jgi:paraquat-inducible protein A
MPPGVRRALRELHPQHALAVPASIVASFVLLFIGLSLPLMYSQKMFWKNTYSVWTGVVELWKQNELALSAILFFFSILFPIVKLVGLSFIWLVRLPEEQRDRLLHWLGILGKWSMLDVFIVAILIVLVKLGPFVKIEPRSGVYVFSAAIAFSMLTTMYIDRLARSPSQHQ